MVLEKDEYNILISYTKNMVFLYEHSFPNLNPQGRQQPPVKEAYYAPETTQCGGERCPTLYGLMIESKSQISFIFKDLFFKKKVLIALVKKLHETNHNFHKNSRI